MALPRIILIVLILNTLILLGSVGLNYHLLNNAAPHSALGLASGEAAVDSVPHRDYQFFPVEKVIVNLRGENRERYFVLDLVLQAELETDAHRLEQIDPIVRNSVVANLTTLGFEELRAMSISDLQGRLESALIADLAARKLNQPFAHVLVSKMIVQ
jgi:flagellar FliL protein